MDDDDKDDSGRTYSNYGEDTPLLDFDGLEEGYDTIEDSHESKGKLSQSMSSLLGLIEKPLRRKKSRGSPSPSRRKRSDSRGRSRSRGSSPSRSASANEARTSRPPSRSRSPPVRTSRPPSRSRSPPVRTSRPPSRSSSRAGSRSTSPERRQHRFGFGSDEGMQVHLSLTKEEVNRCHWATVTFGRAAAWATSFVLMAMGGSQFFEPIQLTDLPISEFIIAGYLIFFGIVFLWTEVSYYFLFKYFGFLFNYLGRGLAYLFVGGLCFGLGNKRFFPLGLLAGGWVCGVGFIFVFLFLFFPDTPNPKPIFESERRN